MLTLCIEHLTEGESPSFRIVWPDGTVGPPVEVPAADGFPVSERGQSNLMAELRWYLEEFLEYPFPPETLRAARALEALDQWGTYTFETLFVQPDGSRLLEVDEVDDYRELQIRLASRDPRVLSWPWEALRDPAAGPLGPYAIVERRLAAAEPPQAVTELPGERLNILLIIARPAAEADIRYRSISQPLLELIAEQNLPVHVHVLRPPTTRELFEHLQEHPGAYHVLHFDGHGAYDRGGYLVFEDATGGREFVSAENLGKLLKRSSIPLVVLNACQSAMLEVTDSVFASVATALLGAGVPSVVAMSTTLYLSSALEFIPAFYRSLFHSNVASAVRDARRQMAEHPLRSAARGVHELRDWLVPVLYQAQDIDLALASPVQTEPSAARNPPQALVGRDDMFLRLERALHHDKAAILIHGLAGIGKTALANGFIRWLQQTGGLAGPPVVIDLAHQPSAGAKLLEHLEDRLLGGVDRDLDRLVAKLREERHVVVLDHLESVAPWVATSTGIAPRLSELLRRLHGGRSKILILGRFVPLWLDGQSHPLLGLQNVEGWWLLRRVARDLDLDVDLSERELSGLIEEVAGHPVALRALLPRWAAGDRRPIDEIFGEWVAQRFRPEPRSASPEGRPEASLLAPLDRLWQPGLPPTLAPLTPLIALHHQFVSASALTAMAESVDETWSRDKVDLLLQGLTRMGLLDHFDPGQSTDPEPRHRSRSGGYGMHPVLRAGLRVVAPPATETASRNAWRRAFIEFMGTFADTLVREPPARQDRILGLQGANLESARQQARNLAMEALFLALTQTLALQAHRLRDWPRALELFDEMAQWALETHRIQAACSAYHQMGIIESDQRHFKEARYRFEKALGLAQQIGAQKSIAAAYHHLGHIAADTGDKAEATRRYRQSLAISEPLGFTDLASATYHQLGLAALEDKDHVTAEAQLQRSLRLDEQRGDKSGIARSRLSLGNIALEQGHPEVARKHYKTSLINNEKDVHLSALIRMQLGRVEQTQECYPEARQEYLEATRLFEAHGDEYHAGAAYNQLGNVFRLEEDLTSAEAWYRKAIKSMAAQGDWLKTARIYHQLAWVLEDQEDLDGARETFLKALALFEDCNENESWAAVCHDLGDLARRSGEASSAATWYQKALPTIDRSGDTAAAEDIRRKLTLLDQEDAEHPNHFRAESFRRVTETFVWKTRDGRQLKIQDMTTGHIFNAMKMIYNHLVEPIEGKSVWMQHRYTEMLQRASEDFDETLARLLFFIYHLEVRGDLPAHYRSPYQRILRNLEVHPQLREKLTNIRRYAAKERESHPMTASDATRPSEH